MRERALITGGGGFIGSCLARTLIDQEQEVHLLLRPQTDRWRLSDIANRCVIHTADLLDPHAVRGVFAAATPEVVYHLATHGHRPEQNHRTTVLAANLLGTAHVLDAAFAEGCRALVHAGSGLEYGPQVGAVEETDAVNPPTDYTVAKAAALPTAAAGPSWWCASFPLTGPGKDEAASYPT